MNAPTQRTRVRRHPERGVYDRAAIDAILDEALICHVGFVADDQPFVIPTIHARAGDTLYLHGSPGSRMLRTFRSGTEVCVTATILDGLVLARSVYNHSMNYRSVVVIGRARPVEDEREKRAALAAVVEHVAPGRLQDARPPNAKELAATQIVALPLTEASAKVRQGPPGDAAEDLDLPVWAGIVPLSLAAGDPEPDERVPPEVTVPAYASAYRRPGVAGGADAPDVAPAEDEPDVSPEKGGDKIGKSGYSDLVPFVKVNGEPVELPADRALALVVRLRASGIHHGEEAATMLEMTSGAAAILTRGELGALHAVIESWVRERGEEAVGDEVLALRRMLAARAA